MCDITPMEIYAETEKYYGILESNHYFQPTLLFKLMYFYHLSPKVLLLHHFTKVSLNLLLENIVLAYKKSME